MLVKAGIVFPLKIKQQIYIVESRHILKKDICKLKFNAPKY